MLLILVLIFLAVFSKLNNSMILRSIFCWITKSSESVQPNLWRPKHSCSGPVWWLTDRICHEAWQKGLDSWIIYFIGVIWSLLWCTKMLIFMRLLCPQMDLKLTVSCKQNTQEFIVLSKLLSWVNLCHKFITSGIHACTTVTVNNW